MSPKYIGGSEAFAAWKESIHAGAAPVLYDVGGEKWQHVEIGPGNVVIVGGPPGGGKTALVNQLTFEAVLRNDGVRAVIANVEMSPWTLLDRQLARLSGISATAVRYRCFDSDAPEAQEAMKALAAALERVAFLQPPFDLENLADTADATDAGLLIVDYIQRFKAPGEFGSPRESMGATMSKLREFSDLGAAVVVVSAMTRGRGDSGATYDRSALGLASFRESSELEYGADSAWLLAEDSDGMHLTCLKNRHGETPDLLLDFDRSHQAFEVVPQIEAVVGIDNRSVGARRTLSRPNREELRERSKASIRIAQQKPEGVDNL